MAMLCLRLALIAVVTIVAAPGKPALEQDPLIKWFDSLGYDAVRDGQFVRVDTTYADGGHVQKGDPVYGFLVTGGAKQFTILTPSLDFMRYPPLWPTESATYTPTSFVAWVRAELAPKKPDRFDWDVEGPLSKRGKLFVLARACAARNLTAESVEFLKRARVEHTRRDPKKPNFAAQLADDFATHALWEAIGDLGDNRVTRKEILARLEQVVRNLPGSPREDVAMENIEMLRTMVSEEDAKPPLSVPIEQLPVEQQVAELIFQLRDQPGFQNSNPGYPSVLDSEATSPAHRLVALGFDAVPQLLDTLQDHRFTRAMRWVRFTGYSRPILVKDACREILAKISSRPFIFGDQSMSEGEYDIKVEEAARAWWKSVREKGEERTLIEGVAVGDYPGSQQAKYLAEKYPESAVSAIRLGLSRATQSSDRETLIVALMPIRQSKQAIDLAKSRMTAGTSLRERLAAARVLSASDPDAAVHAMISAWNRMGRGEPDEACDGLVDFLAGSSRADAVKALAFKLASQPAYLRRLVAQAFCYGPPTRWQQGYPEEGKLPQTEGEVNRYRTAVEDLLAGLLTDVSEANGAILNYSGNSLGQPRVCDLAASGLATLWPQRYTYRVTPSVSARDTMRYATLNVWREMHGYRALVPPMAPPIKPATAGQRSELTRWLVGPASGRKRALQVLMRDSASSLGIVLEKINHEKTTIADHDRLEVLASTLACVVTKVQLIGSGGALGRVAKALKGKSLTSQWVRAFIRKIAGYRGADAHRIEFMAERDEDGRGFAVTVKFSNRLDELNPDSWNCEESIRVNGESISGSGGSYSFWSGEPYLQLAHGLHEALSGPPNQIISIEFSLSRPPKPRLVQGNLKS